MSSYTCDNENLTAVRIRFLSDLARDHYVQISETNLGDRCEETNTLSLYANVSKEREIFLRASLQLLDFKEGFRVKDRALAGYQRSLQYKQSRVGEDENKMHDVIRLGFLKKCSHTNSMSVSTTYRWKTKYVELRHGLFSYADYGSGGSLKDLAHSDSHSATNRRFILLTSDTCDCFSLSDDPSMNHYLNSDCIFAISIRGGSKRLWLAATPDECKEWVRNIKAAILGTPILQKRIRDLNPSVHGKPSSDGENGTNEDDGDQLQDERPSFSASTNLRSWLSIEGPSAPYARNMSLYLELKNSFNAVSSEEEYRAILSGMNKENFKITIPVLFVKSKSSENHFVLSAQDSLSSHNIGKECSSQIWKDLQRDKIVIDNDEITGELGAEAMVGALVRHISEKVEYIKSLEDKQRTERDTKTDGNHLHANSYPYYHHHNPFTAPFSVMEAQIVECARDLLVLCNRTQSGGDTYFCVDALFRGESSKDLCLLAPFSPEAEPLNFKVDIVEIHKEHIPTLHRKSYYPKDGLNASSFKGFDQKPASQIRRVNNHHFNEIKSQSPSGLSESKVRFEFQDTPTVALYDSNSSNAGLSGDHDVSSLITGNPEEQKRRPQLDLTEILEKDGYLMGLRRHSEINDKQEWTASRMETDILMDNAKTTPSKFSIAAQHLLSASKDDQSIVSELTFDTYLKHAVTNGAQHADPFHGTSGDEEPIPRAEKGVSNLPPQKKSLFKRIGKKLNLPKFSDLEGINSPFGKRRPSMKSESSGDEKVLSHNHFSREPRPSELFRNTTGGKSQETSQDPKKTLCVRVQVQANSKFKLCTLNPSGHDESDTWATLSGTFYQSFYIVGDGSGHLGMADRLVTIHVDSCNFTPTKTGDEVHITV